MTECFPNFLRIFGLMSPLFPSISQRYELAGLFHTMTLSALAVSQVSAEEGDRNQCESTDRSALSPNVPTQIFSRVNHADSKTGDERANFSASAVHNTPDDMVSQYVDWAGVKEWWFWNGGKEGFWKYFIKLTEKLFDAIQCNRMWCNIKLYDKIRCKTIWYNVMWCDLVWWNVMRCIIIWCDAIRYNVMWCNMIRYDAIQYDLMRCDVMRYDMMWCDAIWYNIMRYDTIQYDVMSYDTLQWDAIRCDALQYDTMWFDAI